MKLTKKELVLSISEKCGCTKTDANKMFDSLIGTIKENVLAGNTIHLREFGTFFMKHKAEKKVRNLHTMEEILISAHDEPAFRRSKEWKK